MSKRLSELEAYFYHVDDLVLVLPRGAIRQYVDGLNVNVLSIQDDWARRVFMSEI
ncbi:MAG: hypothetical protein P3W96_002140 [Halomonas sp.]|nr:hypothetical protein [Halomonas sp.]MDM7480801.1 hypothetical protein [Halomonas sp.]